MAERRLSFRGWIVPPAGCLWRKICSRNLSCGDFPGNDYLQTHRVGVFEDCTERFCSRHFQLLAVVCADQDKIFVGNLKLNTYQRPDSPPLQLSGPLMSRCEVRDDRGRIDTTNPGPTIHRPDTVSQNGLLVFLVGDVNEGD